MTLRPPAFAAFATTLLLAVACGSPTSSDPDPLDPIDPGDPGDPVVDSARIASSVTPPPGATFDVDDLRVMSGLDVAEVDATGEAMIVHAEGSSHIAWAIDADDDIVMAGFIDDDQQTISAETTAHVLAFIGLQGHLRDFEIQEAIRDGLPTAPEMADLVTAVEMAIAADADAVQDGALTETVRDWVEARFDEIAVAGPDVAGIVADPAIGRNGFQISEVDLEHFAITNNKRRRARAFVYPLRITREGGEEVVIDTDIAGSDVPLSVTRIPSPTAIRSFVGVVTDWAKGSGADFAAVTTPPIEAPLAADEIEAVHAVRIITPSAPVPDHWLTEAELDALFELRVETFAIDWILPLMLDMAGHSQLFNGTGTVASEAMETFASRFGPILGSVPAAEAKVAEGDLQGAFEDFVFAMYNEAGAGLFTDMFDNLLVPLLNSLLPDEHAALVRSPGSALKVLEMTDVLMKAIDYGRLAYAGLDPVLTELEVTASLEDVVLVPESVETVHFVPKTFRAFPRNTVPDGAVVAYEWTISGIGRLVDSRGRSGTTLETSDGTVDFDPNQLVSGPTSGTLTVDITYSLPGAAPVELGSDTSVVIVHPNEQRLRPSRPKVQCRSNVRLHLQRNDGQVTVVENPSWDWRVEWRTAGSYGTFGDGSTQTTRYNKPDMVYSCTDTEVEDAEEVVYARVYRSEKAENDWTFVSEATATIEIDNDPNLRIIHKPLQVQLVEILPDDPDYERWTVMLVASVTPPSGPPNPLSYSVRSYGFNPGAPTWLEASGFWRHGFSSARPAHESLRDEDHLTNGSYLYVVSATGCEGARELERCTPATMADAVALYQGLGGWLEIVIELEDLP